MRAPIEPPSFREQWDSRAHAETVEAQAAREAAREVVRTIQSRLNEAAAVVTAKVLNSTLTVEQVDFDKSTRALARLRIVFTKPGCSWTGNVEVTRGNTYLAVNIPQYRVWPATKRTFVDVYERIPRDLLCERIDDLVFAFFDPPKKSKH